MKSSETKIMRQSAVAMARSNIVNVARALVAKKASPTDLESAVREYEQLVAARGDRP